MGFFRQLEIIIRQLWFRTGGASDLINETVEDAQDGAMAKINSRLCDIENMINEIQSETHTTISVKQELPHNETVSLDDIYKRLNDLEAQL